MTKQSGHRYRLRRHTPITNSVMRWYKKVSQSPTHASWPDGWRNDELMAWVLPGMVAVDRPLLRDLSATAKNANHVALDQHADFLLNRHKATLPLMGEGDTRVEKTLDVSRRPASGSGRTSCECSPDHLMQRSCAASRRWRLALQPPGARHEHDT